MKSRFHRFAPLVLVMTTATLQLLNGCSSLPRSPAPSTAQTLHRSSPGHFAVTQVRRASDARFELCAVDACPLPTPKTLAARAQALAGPMPLVVSAPSMPTVSPPSPAQIVAVPADTIQAVSETAQAPATEVKTLVVTFASGSALLTAAARDELAVLVPEARGADVIEIRGRTDELGSAALNEVLARNRALAVRDYLRAQSLPEGTTIRVSSKGACCYVADNDTAEGRAANRRVEIEWRSGAQLAQRTTHEYH